jgi:hypothetical protein
MSNPKPAYKLVPVANGRHKLILIDNRPQTTFLPNSIIDYFNNEKKYAENTIKLMDCQIKRLSLAIFNHSKFELSDWTDNGQQVIENMTDIVMSDAGQKAHLNSIQQVLKASGLEMKDYPYYQKFGELANGLKTNPYVAPNKLTKLVWADIETKRDQLLVEIQSKSDSYLKSIQGITLYRQFIIMCIYTYIVPLRPQEWLTAKLKRTEPIDGNHLDLTLKQIVIKDYKTAGTHGLRIISLPDRLCEILDSYLKYTGADYLFMSNSKVTTGSNFSTYFSTASMKVNGEQINATFLRNLYVSEKIPNMSVEERVKTAKDMGHTPMTQVMTYSKYNKLLNPLNDSFSP